MALTLIKKDTHINFTGLRRIAYALSCGAVLLGVAAILLHGGIRYGVDFAGGVVVHMRFERAVADEAVKTALAGIALPGLTVQHVGDDNTEYLLRFSASEEGAVENLRGEVNEAFARALPGTGASIERLEMVGPKVGADLRNNAVEALFYAVLLITVYISGRFEQSWFAAAGIAVVMWGVVWLAGLTPIGRIGGVGVAMCVTVLTTWKLKLNFALGAIVSLLHDVFVTLGIIMLMGVEIDLNIIAALLTLVGYSLNDTIIVFDRIRENLRKIPADAPQARVPDMGSVINESINQTLSRTIMTSGTTLFTGLSLYFLGGSVIHDFALTIVIGVIVGTYSSIFVASPILMHFGDVFVYRQAQKEAQAYERPGEHGVV